MCSCLWRTANYLFAYNGACVGSCLMLSLIIGPSILVLVFSALTGTGLPRFQARIFGDWSLPQSYSTSLPLPSPVQLWDLDCNFTHTFVGISPKEHSRAYFWAGVHRIVLSVYCLWDYLIDRSHFQNTTICLGALITLVISSYTSFLVLLKWTKVWESVSFLNYNKRLRSHSWKYWAVSSKYRKVKKELWPQNICSSDIHCRYLPLASISGLFHRKMPSPYLYSAPQIYALLSLNNQCGKLNVTDCIRKMCWVKCRKNESSVYSYNCLGCIFVFFSRFSFWKMMTSIMV